MWFALFDGGSAARMIIAGEADSQTLVVGRDGAGGADSGELRKSSFAASVTLPKLLYSLHLTTQTII